MACPLPTMATFGPHMPSKPQFAFLDSNVYLGLFRLPAKDLAELGKLVKVAEGGLLTLYLPDQVLQEVRRNRARVIAEFITPLHEATFAAQLPEMYRDSEEYKQLAESVSASKQARDQILIRLRSEARTESLPADLLLQKLFTCSTQIACDEVVELGRTRHALGHPPGKKGSLGDAVNWEALLQAAPRKATLNLVTNDSDFVSPLDREQPNEYLRQEWAERKCGKLVLYRNLPDFLKDRFATIQLTTNLRKASLIEELVASESFEQTHAVVAKLQRYSEFELDEANRMLEGGLENDQIRWLANDDDVHGLFRRLIHAHRPHLPKLLVAKWDLLLAGRIAAYASIPSDAKAKRFLQRAAGS